MKTKNFNMPVDILNLVSKLNIQRCSIENQKGANPVQNQWQ